jgi:hypothetical protein
MRTAARRLGETAPMQRSSRFSSRLWGGRFNRSGDDSREGLSRYWAHFFSSLLARRHFFPYPLHRLTITPRPQVPSESIGPRALSRTPPLANVRICSRKQGHGGRRASWHSPWCAHKCNISMYAIDGNTSEPPLFSRDNFLLIHFSPLICEWARTPKIEQLSFIH